MRFSRGLSWKQNFRGNHTETAILLFQALKRLHPRCYFITEETIKFGDGGYVVDFLFKEVNLVVEVDGEVVHDRSDVQRRKTRQKKLDIESLGFTVLSFLNKEVVGDRDGVADKVAHKYYELQNVRDNKQMEKKKIE